VHRGLDNLLAAVVLLDPCCDKLDRLVYRTLGSMPGSQLPY
jgi:hypothetical protein